MRTNGIQKRKNRIILKKLFFSFGIFLFTLLLCILLFGWKWIVGEPLTSPIGKINSRVSQNTDANVFVVRAFCEEKKLPCTTVVQSAGTITITLKNNAIILLSAKQDIQKELASLQVTLSQLTIEGKQFKKLDFRFDKPFITF